MPSMASWMRRRWSGSSFVRRTSVRRSSQRLQRVIGRIDSGFDAISTSRPSVIRRSQGSFEVRSEALLAIPAFPANSVLYLVGFSGVQLQYTWNRST